MDERRIQRRLKRITVIVVLVSALILMGGSFVASSLNNIQADAMNTQMQTEAEEYRTYILRQIDGDLQTLYTLASYLEFSETLNQEQFAKGLYESNNQNDFVRMAYFPLGKAGIRVTAELSIETNVTVDSLSETMQRVIRAAWEGESGISRIYHDSQLDEDVYGYGVPVYENGIVVGALVASHSTQLLVDILANATVLNGQGYIHLIGQEGRFLVRSQQRVVQEFTSSIYDGSYFTEENKTYMQELMAQNESGFASFRYEGETYQVFLEPVGVNGWYLFCVNTAQGINGPMNQILVVTRITFLGILLLAVVLIFYGYRQMRRYNKELLQAAYRDSLTGAYNLARFTQLLDEETERLDHGSVLALNLRQFKFFNEIFGREQADQMLCHIKQVLDEAMGEGEFFCRDTADSFYLFLREEDRETIRQRLAAIYAGVTEREFQDSNRNYKLLMYCGIAGKRTDQGERRTADRMMTDALFALAKARENGQDSIWFYDEQLHKKEQLENYVESHMHQALQNGEFKLYLQPKMDLKRGVLGGAEALVRWITGEGKMVYPDQFIPQFERNGFCVQLDLYMVEQVCRQLRAWLDAGLEPIPLSVNQSKLLFYEADYIRTLSGLVDRYGIPAQLITLEILEGLALERAEELNAKIAQLQARGFRISLDDFGSGYSSLNTLGSLNIDELKLDRAFLLEASNEASPRHRIIMEQIVQLTKQLQISTVVEGVETAENERFIQALGCDFGQGYYYSRPISAETFDQTYMQTKPDTAAP